ncbi:MAG: hypothetical protein F6K09_26305 [Merismopedia sp. SIO2A8]|nr:hypothetical protein [Symploca sp. SIO2B6]NET52075.1 hypothetical protein [Merismopedia sp. SIO2A8]
MIDYWGLYNGKSHKELNPYNLRRGDFVIAPDGTTGRLDSLGFKWGFLEGSDRSCYALVDLRPVS